MGDSFKSKLESIRSGFRDELQQVQQRMDEYLLCERQAVNSLADHLKKSRGKMLRPLALLAAGRACGKISDEHIKVASVLEMIHSATLLHDDVIDEGMVRRQQPTVNRLWGNEAAVLLGDYILSHALRVCAGMPAGVTQRIADSVVATCQGEICQDMAKQNWDMSEQQYLGIITDKSGRMFENSCFLGAMLAGADQRTCERLGRFGVHLGIIYQVTDDVLDVVATRTDSDKTVGRDIARFNITLPLICLLGRLDGPQRERLTEQLEQSAIGRGELGELMEQNGCFDYSFEFVQGHIEEAFEQLQNVQPGGNGEILREIAELIAARSRRIIAADG